MRILVVFALVIGILNIFIGTGSFLLPFGNNPSHIQELFDVIQTLVGIGFIYIAANPDRVLKPRKKTGVYEKI